MKELRYHGTIVLDDEELEKAMQELEDARHALYDAYNKLMMMGVVKFEKADSGN